MSRRPAPRVGRRSCAPIGRWHTRLVSARPKAIGGGAAVTLGAVTLIVAASVYRMVQNAAARYPGHADPAFYYSVARNLRAGHGARIDYVWQFLSPESHLQHYAFDYWLPLPSLLMAVGLHLGNGLPAALDVNTALIAVTALGTLSVARSLAGSAYVAGAAAAIVALLPSMSMFAARSESAASLAACAMLTLATALAARTRPWLWPVAGLFAGLASIARNEGLLLIVVLLWSVLAWHTGWALFTRFAATLAGCLLVLVPTMVVNLHEFGALLAPASSHFAFIVHYPQLYALHVADSPGALFSGGLRHFAMLRLQTVGDQVQVALRVFSRPLAIGLAAILLIGGLFALRHRSRLGLARLRSPWLLPVGYLLAVLVFEAVVTPVVASAGAIQKSMISVAPVFVIAALHAGRRLPVGPAPRVLGAVALLGYAATTVAVTTHRTIEIDNQVGASVATLRSPLAAEQRCLGRRLVLMTRAPWEITEATGYPTVQIPYASFQDVIRTARRYGVTDLTSQTSLAEHSLAELSRPGGPLIRVRGVEAFPLYRIRALAGRSRCGPGRHT